MRRKNKKKGKKRHGEGWRLSDYNTPTQSDYNKPTQCAGKRHKGSKELGSNAVEAIRSVAACYEGCNVIDYDGLIRCLLVAEKNIGELGSLAGHDEVSKAVSQLVRKISNEADSDPHKEWNQVLTGVYYISRNLREEVNALMSLFLAKSDLSGQHSSDLSEAYELAKNYIQTQEGRCFVDEVNGLLKSLTALGKLGLSGLWAKEGGSGKEDFNRFIEHFKGMVHLLEEIPNKMEGEFSPQKIDDFRHALIDFKQKISHFQCPGKTGKKRTSQHQDPSRFFQFDSLGSTNKRVKLARTDEEKKDGTLVSAKLERMFSNYLYSTTAIKTSVQKIDMLHKMGEFLEKIRTLQCNKRSIQIAKIINMPPSKTKKQQFEMLRKLFPGLDSSGKMSRKNIVYHDPVTAETYVVVGYNNAVRTLMENWNNQKLKYQLMVLSESAGQGKIPTAMKDAFSIKKNHGNLKLTHSMDSKTTADTQVPVPTPLLVPTLPISASQGILYLIAAAEQIDSPTVRATEGALASSTKSTMYSTASTTETELIDTTTAGTATTTTAAPSLATAMTKLTPR